MSDLIGTYLGQYHLTAIISHGGTATVYKALQPSLGRHVAIKVMYRERDPQFSLRFKREARVIAQLQHPNILPIYESGEQDGLLYLVLRYVEGGVTLDHLLGEPMQPLRALQLVERLLAALEYAHQRGIIHRDVKPANVLMPGPEWPMLADFGIAKLSSEDQHLTYTGLIIGTAAYMAPEQALGEQTDARSDLYALGIVLYEMLTGRVPFEAANAMAVLNKHINMQPPPPRQFVPHLHAAVESFLMRALAKDPNERYQSATEMAQALRQVLLQLEVPSHVFVEQPERVEQLVRPASVAEVAPKRAYRPVRRFWPKWTPLGLALVLIGGGGGIGWLGLRGAAAQPSFFVAASATATSTTAPTNTNEPTTTPTATATHTPTATATHTPTATHTAQPTATHTAQPTATQPPPTQAPPPTAKPATRPQATVKPKATAKPVVQPTAAPAVSPPTTEPVATTAPPPPEAPPPTQPPAQEEPQPEPQPEPPRKPEPKPEPTPEPAPAPTEPPIDKEPPPPKPKA